jgi:steroid delta-isomerase-like uncharacterized protein
MDLSYCQRWISLFGHAPEELIALYSPRFLFEDINMGIRIENDLAAMKAFQAGFINANPDLSYNRFEVSEYIGDRRLGSFQWTWEAKHGGDFFQVPAKGKITRTRGVTVMGWDEQGRITLERSIWDAWAVLEQLGAVPKRG